jgi:hypothetical protein
MVPKRTPNEPRIVGLIIRKESLIGCHENARLLWRAFGQLNV